MATFSVDFGVRFLERIRVWGKGVGTGCVKTMVPQVRARCPIQGLRGVRPGENRHIAVKTSPENHETGEEM